MQRQRPAGAGPLPHSRGLFAPQDAAAHGSDEARVEGSWWLFCLLHRKSFLLRKFDKLQKCGESSSKLLSFWRLSRKDLANNVTDKCANQMQESTHPKLPGLQGLLKAQLQVDSSVVGALDPSEGVERTRISQE